MIRLIKISFCLLIFLLTTNLHQFGGNVYYLDSKNGNDSNNGLTPAAAWKTIGKVNDSWAVISQGADILFKRGETFTDQRLKIQKGGEELDPMIIGAYGEGQKPVISNAYGGILCITEDVSYVRVEDLHIKDITNESGVVFSAENMSHITISRVDVENIENHNGIALSKVNTYVIEDCVISNVKNAGIAILGTPTYQITNGIIRNNTVHDITGDGLTLHKDGNGNNIGADHQILNNVFYNCGEDGIDITSGKNTLIRGNETFNNQLHGVGAGREDLWIDKHYSHDELGDGIYISDGKNAKLTSSIIYNAGGYSLVVNDIKKFEGYNNTIVHTNSDRGIVSIASGTRNAIFKNNIILSLQRGDGLFLLHGESPSVMNSDFDYNVWWNPDGNDDRRFWDPESRLYNFSYWQSHYNQDVNGSFLNPSFLYPKKADFRLRYHSPCIDAGIDVGLDSDFEGTEIPQGAGPDIGAFEQKGRKEKVIKRR